MSTEFPKATLEQAMKLPEALQRNGGQPLPKIDMATALGISPGSSSLRTWGSASSAYGLTGGSYRSEFSMAEIGVRIMTPTSSEEKARALIDSALRPEVFRRVFDYYKGKKFPEPQFFINTLKREFEVAESQAQAFVDIFTDNMKFVGLVRATTTGDWLSKALPTSSGETNAETEDVEPPFIDAAVVLPPAEGTSPQAPDDVQRRKRPNKLFIGHGRSKRPLDQLTKTLRELGIPHVVAEDEANSGRPISQKVRETMDQCGAAILNL